MQNPRRYDGGGGGDDDDDDDNNNNNNNNNYYYYYYYYSNNNVDVSVGVSLFYFFVICLATLCLCRRHNIDDR